MSDNAAERIRGQVNYDTQSSDDIEWNSAISEVDAALAAPPVNNTGATDAR